jgi:uncharacterized protein (UPF0332 family)
MTSSSKRPDARRIKGGAFSRRQVDDLLALARRDLRTAKKLQESDPDWAFNIGYNAMLQAARAWMFSRGFRPVGQAQHRSVIEFLKESLPGDFREMTARMDRMRRKRNDAVYETAGLISRAEAAEGLQSAETFVEALTKLLQPMRG